MDFEEKTLKRTEIYQGPIFKLVKDEVQLPAGKGTAYRDLIFHNGAVAVIALTPEDKMILVKQYRKAIEATSYEIPALRELEEETGYSGDLDLLYDFYSAIGFCNERIRLYSASHLTKVENPRPQDEDETLELFEVTLEEAKALLASGDICDAKTIIALQYWEMKMNRR